MNLKFSFATTAEAAAIATLVNSAYRGESSKQGWTTEADLLGGQRTDSTDIKSIIETPNSYIVIARILDEIIGSCEIIADKNADELYFGMFTIKPSLQNKGIGKLFLNHVEDLARTWNLKQMTMTVISVRTELIDYYKRRGYLVTNRFIPFSKDAHFGLPKVSDLKLVFLIKGLS